ncbi:phage virion morphogenesis protein [Ralstonia pseudosolanacearum]|nr:phage virion morphogenesis protein [Ralstonia pseudosolanacearum]MCK4152000.1 phage virion morphogenesis protein [Ralstonia pseudosolanacearum]
MDVPAGRVLPRAVAVELRRRQAKRIAEEHNPGGSPYVSHKPRLRHKRENTRRAMLMRLRLARYMKTETDANTAAVTFAGSAQRIANVHHFGLRDRVNKTWLIAQYPVRKLLGLDDEHIQYITDLTLQHLAR